MPQQQEAQYGEPTPLFQQNEIAQKERIQNSHLDPLLILQSPLEHPKHRINPQIHRHIRTPSEDPILNGNPFIAVVDVSGIHHLPVTTTDLSNSGEAGGNAAAGAGQLRYHHYHCD